MCISVWQTIKLRSLGQNLSLGVHFILLGAGSRQLEKGSPKTREMGKDLILRNRQEVGDLILLTPKGIWSI